MKNKIILLFAAIFFSTVICAQDVNFSRKFIIDPPVIENTGFGNIVAGVDFDGDGKKEIYAVNNMLDQGGAELIPRIYKFENNGTSFDSVWSHEMIDIPMQNSWPALTYGDWDKDGKMELIWGPANNLSSENLNPSRIIVFEYPGDGSDNMGAPNFGGNIPNAQWTITEQDNFELRPIVWTLTDIDGDGEDELVFADRKSNYRFGVVSVDDIPDDGISVPNWTLEANGEGQGIMASTIYDGARLGNSFLLFHSDGSVTQVKYGGGAWTIGANKPDAAPGGSWRSAMTVDIDGDGSQEVITGGWSSGYNDVYLIYDDAFMGLTTKVIAHLSSYIGASGRLNGGDFGDIDQDGNIDIVFGTRAATPNGAIVRIEYSGTGDFTDSLNWSVQVIDSLISDDTGQRFDVVKIANVDDDPYEEVIYTDGNQPGRIPIVVLDPDVQTGVEKVENPREFYLSQNYPNPFNPETNIEFNIPRSSASSRVNLTVYDALGKEVSVLVDGELSAGNHIVRFNAASAGLSSGIYFYKLSVDNYIQIKKMTLLK